MAQLWKRAISWLEVCMARLPRSRALQSRSELLITARCVLRRIHGAQALRCCARGSRGAFACSPCATSAPAGHTPAAPARRTDSVPDFAAEKGEEGRSRRGAAL